jgi:hypothetical protein
MKSSILGRDAHKGLVNFVLNFSDFYAILYELLKLELNSGVERNSKIK